MYQWKHLSFDLPGRLDDETVLLFTDQRDPPRFTLTVTEDQLGRGASLAAYVDGALGELKADVDSYEALSRQDRQIGSDGRISAVEIEHTLTLQGNSSRQIQLYIGTQAGVTVLTATANDDGMIDARAALEALAASLKVN